MATMIKEKKPKKKKSKSKNCDLEYEVEESSSYVLGESKKPLIDFNVEGSSESEICRLDNVGSIKFYEEIRVNVEPNLLEVNNPNPILSVTDEVVANTSKDVSEKLPHFSQKDIEGKRESKRVAELAYKDLYAELENITVNEHEKMKDELETEKSSNTELNKLASETVVDVQSPSAPMFYETEETIETITSHPEESVKNVKFTVSCLPIEEVIRIFGGKEMCMVKEMSDQEESLVEFGCHLQPQHPLVDLIAHFRSSLAAVERERQRISHGYKEEQKARADLWKIEKQKRNISEKCSCGADVALLVTFDYAELQKNKLAAAKFRLESLLRDVLDSYCSHQHEAMLTYCEIQDLIGLIIQRSKLEIRDSLAFILQSLKCSDEFGDVYVKILQEWSFTLASALFKTEPDMRDLLYLLHLLFRQSRSVRWAEQVVRLPVDDFSSAARFIAFLDILLSQPVPESALECTEESQESVADAWEELDASGTGGAVGKGRLREGDLLAILKVLPLRELIASLVLLSKEEMEGGREEAWSGAAGGGVLKASCGVRVLLYVAARALPLYRAYRTAHALLRRLALAALRALAALHLHSRSWYQVDIKDRICAELEACFVLGFTHLAEDRHELPTTLLDDDALSQYCFTFMSLLHVNMARRIEPLGIDAPAMSCAERVRIVACAAAEHRNSALANTVLEFLLQTGIKRNSSNSEPCKDKCESAARELIPRVISAHPYLHTAAFYMLADINKVESIDPLSVAALSPAEWRPSPTEVQDVLDDWSLKCPALIEHLLLQIDCTPHKGMSLESQLVVGAWLCTYTRGRGEVEWAWSVLRRLNIHRALWGLPPEAPAPTATDSLMEQAFALLACDWGHLVPLVCSTGVSALRRLATARTADAVHVLDCVMRVLALSPESVALTPEFTEVFTTIVNAGPSLMQRALGRGGRSGQQMLRRLLLDQLHEYRSCAVRRSSLLAAWLHALWRPALPSASRAILDAALRATRDWRTLDAHVMYVLEENGSQMLNDAVTHANVAPLLAHGALRGALALEQRAGLAARLLPALLQQRQRGERVHVDNALKFIGSKLGSEELVIHRAAASALLAPLEDPSHLTLWSLFFYVYLQRPPDTSSEGTPPAGPLFFSGIIKTRTLNQLKKRLQETVIYHRSAAKGLKSTDDVTKQATAADSTPIEPEDCMFPPLTLKDLRGDALLMTTVDRDEDKIGSECEKETDDAAYLISYHTAAEKLVLMYEHWLSEGEELRALQHHADVARFLTEQDLDAAWKASLGRDLNPDTPPPSPRSECAPALTYYQQIIQAIDMLKNESNRRVCAPRGVSSVPNINYNDQRAVTAQVEKHLQAIEKLVQGWSAEVRRARSLDTQLWPIVARLRVRTPLPSVRQPCPKGCRPLCIRIEEYEWRQSSAAAREIEENRRSAATQVRRLAQPNTHAVRVTAALIAISRRITDKAVAMQVLEDIHCSSDDERAPAHRSLISFITYLAERWVCSDGAASARLLQRWNGAGAHALCGAVVHPARPHARHWRPLYRALLQARLPPPDAFSYLSRFDMVYWATVVGEDERREVLEALLEAARRFGEKSDEEYQMLIELVGVHSAKICLATDTLRHVQCCVRAAASASRHASLPAAYLAHLAMLVTNHRSLLDFTQLEQILVELGAVWNATSASDERYVAYAPHIASLLRALLRAYVVVAVTKQSYTPENVGGRVWTAARGVWSPWVTPGPPRLLPPKPPEPRECYTNMLDHFVDTLVQIMDDCPGCDIYLLRHVWEWTVETYLASQEQPQQTQLRATALLAHTRRLPWRRQWFVSASLLTAHRVSWLNVPSLNAWCCYTWERVTADSWLRGAEGQLLRVLQVLFEIFTSKYLQMSPAALEEACRLPWHALPADATHGLLEAYYTHYHNPAQPYHDLPHFKLVLRVSELGDTCALDEMAQLKRCQAVSVWVSRAAAPALALHASGHARCLLRQLQRVSPLLESCDNYLEQLICRAIAMLFMEPAAKEALPLWQEWACSCTPRARRALAAAASSLGAADAFAPLADTLAQQILADADAGGWSTLWRPLVPGQQGAPAVLRRQHYHAAYALVRTAPQTSATIRDIVAALAASPVSFTEKEVIISLWICALCRLASDADSSRRPSLGDVATGGEQIEEGREEAYVVRALLAKWAELKRSLLQVVTLQHATVPTQRHRLLCHLGLCVLSPSQPIRGQSPCKDYETACHTVSTLGVNPNDILKWGHAPKLDYLPRLAIMLFPDQKIYFEEELDLVSGL